MKMTMASELLYLYLDDVKRSSFFLILFYFGAGEFAATYFTSYLVLTNWSLSLSLGKVMATAYAWYWRFNMGKGHETAYAWYWRFNMRKGHGDRLRLVLAI
jgi:hypothetical protein